MMKNIFKKLGGAFLGLALGLGVVAGVASAPKAHEVRADQASFTLTSASEVTVNGVTASFAQGGGSSAPAWYNAGLRLYAKNNFVLSCSNNITNVTINWEKQGSKEFSSASANVGSYSHPSQAGTGTWTGSAKEIVFTLGASGQLQLNTFSVTYTAGGSPTTNYTVTFDANGHGTAPQAATVASGEKVSRPTDPSASGYTFGGWYKEAGCTTAYDFNTAVTSSFTLYAKWTENGGPTPPTPSGDSYVKVTSNLEDWSGQYLIVYEKDNTAYCWTGVDEKNCYATSSINNNVISAPSGAATVTIESMTGGYSIKVNGGDNDGTYISGTSAQNKLNFNSSAQKNTISYDSSVLIESNTSVLRFNNNDSEMRFRYYKSSGYSNQQAIQLYKLNEEEPEEIDLTNIALTPTAEVIVGSSIDLTPIKTPSNANNKVTFTWESLTPSVATVVDGKVTGVSVGTATIRINATDIGKSATCTVTVNPVPPVKVDNTIADCYTIGIDKSVSFNGLYMGTYGTSAKDGIFFADGAYGILIYGTTSVPSGWEVGKTVVAVKGTTANFNGLVQVKNATFELTSATVSTPEVYTFLGNETTAVALSRKTSISGTIASISGQTDNKFVSGTDGKVTVTLDNGGTAMIFIKKNVHTSAELDEFSEKLVVGSYVVATGFLNYYKGGGTYDGKRDPACFQIVAPTIISTSKYDAEAFAKDFLADTDAICSVAKDDHSSELLAAWSDIAAKYTALDDTERAAVVAADAKADTDLGKAVARYDYLVAKYGLNEFIEGRTVEPIRTAGFIARENNNTSTIIIVIVSVVSLTTLGALIMIKRRKTNDK